MKNKLFFDIYITGHHSEYISHLVDFLAEKKDENLYYFVLHPEFSARFPKIALKAKGIKNIVWIQVTSVEYEKCVKANLLKKSFLELQLASHYAEINNVNHLCLLYFNTFQLAIIFFRSKYTISGILFLQFYRMNRNGIVNKLKYFRKYIITKIYCYNPCLTTVFILNDKKTADFLNEEFNTTKFRMLPDPIPQLQPLVNFDIYNHYNIDRNRKIFLHIGSLGERKGTNEVVESIMHISDSSQKFVAVLLVGNVNDSFLNSKIQSLVSNNSTNVEFIFDNSFVSNEMMKSLFDQCDFVLMPYKNTEASSGILGHAVASNKKVIATGKGLIREIIEENKLGVLLEEPTPKQIADKIEIFLEDKNNFSNESHSFIEEHSIEKFAESVLEIN